MSKSAEMEKPTDIEVIPALQPRDKDGYQFVCYADCCSGIPGTQHEATFALINTVLRRLDPQPEFITFPGDEIRGLTLDEETLHEQWRHWIQTEMGWLDRKRIPFYHTTGNHTAYDASSIKVFKQVHTHLPQNGPAEQKGLSYSVYYDNLLLVFVNTLNMQLGGEGFVETAWLEDVLAEHSDVKHKLVFGHHPVFPVNGYNGQYQRHIGKDCGTIFWDILVNNNVTAYMCSHMLAFDVQIHQGVLQIMSAGAGTSPLMPADREYHHLVQVAVDNQGLRYQTLDSKGIMREWLEWPPELPPTCSWKDLPKGTFPAPQRGEGEVPFIVWRFTGTNSEGEDGHSQTLLSCWDQGDSPSLIWIGCRGKPSRVTVQLRHTPGRSPHFWLGPQLTPEAPFDFQIALHPGMGPGGVLWRLSSEEHWTSMEAASPWGPERVLWPSTWCLGQDRDQPENISFRGKQLHISWTGYFIEKPVVPKD